MLNRCLDVEAERLLQPELLSSGALPIGAVREPAIEIDVEGLVALARALTLLEPPRPSAAWLAASRRRLLDRLRGPGQPAGAHPLRDASAVCFLGNDRAAHDSSSRRQRP